MFQSLGITEEQVYGDVFTAWLRDTHEKNTPDSKQMFRDAVEAGFLERQVVMRRHRLGVNVMTSLATMLHRSPLTKLDLHGNALRDIGCEVLAHLMRDLPNLAYLDLGANDIGGNGVQSLSFVVAQHRKLTTLILGSSRDDPYANRITPASATILLEGCLRSRTLRHLDLSGNAFLMDAPAAAGSNGDGAGTATSSHGENGGDGDANNTTGRTQEWNGTSGSAADFSIGGGGALGGTGANMDTAVARRPIDLLEQLLRTSTTLSVLKLKDVSFSASGALMIISALAENSVLGYLDISYNDLPKVVADALGELLHGRIAMRNTSALHTLVLSGNNLFHTHARPRFNQTTDLASPRGGLVESATSTTNFTFATVGSPRVISPGASMSASGVGGGQGEVNGGMAARVHVLLAVLSNDRLITTLEMNRCDLGDSALSTLCRSLMSNLGLTTLSLKDNAISSNGAVSLGRALCRHTSLKRLYLSGNIIEDEGACALATVLSGNSPLEVLDIQRTWLGDRGLIALGVALQSNTTLRVLQLSDNHFTNNGGDSFAAFLERNVSVLKCNLGATSVPHPTILRMERATTRNVIRVQNAEPDALKRELVRLHFQRYKLAEAKIEMESLRDKNADVKRGAENFELQFKQDQSDYAKKIRELQEQIESYTSQEGKYEQQALKLQSDLVKAREAFDENSELARQRLEIEVAQREKVEAEYNEVEAELNEWKNNAAGRETMKRGLLENIKADMANWQAQRREYKEQMDALQEEVRLLETQTLAKAARRSTSSGSKKNGKNGKKSSKKSKKG